MMRKIKECRFCKEGITSIDPFAPFLGNFLSEKGKILPRKSTGLCAYHQRKLAVAIKRARNLGILPYVIK